MDAKLTPAAEKFIRRMMRFAAGAEAGFRLRVAPGGCSGFAVTFDLAEAPEPKEIVWSPAGLRIFLDAESRLLLDKSVVDFSEGRTDGGITVTAAGQTGQSCSQAMPLVSIGSLVRN